MTTTRHLYQSVDIINTFIGEIAVEHDPELLKIKAYGNPEQIKKDRGKCYEPVFYSNDVHNYLFNTVKNSERYFKEYDDTEKSDVCVNLIQTNKQGTVYSKSQSCRMLTKFGLYRAFISAPKTNGAKIFKRFVWILLDKLERERTVDYNQVKEELDAEHARACSLERANFEQAYEIKKHSYVEDIFENAELQGENEQKMYHLMQKKFLKPICIYVIDSKYIQKKPKKTRKPKTKKSRAVSQTPIKKGQSGFELYGLSESDEDNSSDEKNDQSRNTTRRITDTDSGNLDYDYHRCNKYNLESDPNEEYYFFIPSWISKTINQNQVKRGVFKYAFDIHIENKEHYSYMIDLLNDPDSKTSAGVFKTTYSNIIESSQSSFINIATREIRKHTLVDNQVDSLCDLNMIESLQSLSKNICENTEKKPRKAWANDDSSGSDVDGYNDSSNRLLK
jgi:hypothetical protein